MPTASASKAFLRQEMLSLRRALPFSFRCACDAQLIDHFSKFLGTLHSDTIISGYIGLGAELDAAPLLAKANRQGFITALPALADSGILKFYHWDPNDPLTRDAMGVRVPARQIRELQPDVCLVPVLAFDLSGGRLGRGAGHFDRALLNLRKEKSVIILGVGFSAQEVSHVPMEPHDQALNAVLTEKGFQSLSKSSF